MVHPDKCSHPNAKDAFEMLNSANTSLLSEERRREIIHVLNMAKGAQHLTLHCVQCIHCLAECRGFTVRSVSFRLTCLVTRNSMFTNNAVLLPPLLWISIHVSQVSHKMSQPAGGESSWQTCKGN